MRAVAARRPRDARRVAAALPDRSIADGWLAIERYRRAGVRPPLRCHRARDLRDFVVLGCVMHDLRAGADPRGWLEVLSSAAKRQRSRAIVSS